MPIWANQVSPLQNWYPIIYIHNDMINSVRYAELGEACLARRVRSARIVIIPYIYSAGEACLAPTKPCGGKAIDVILLPLQGAKM